MWNELDTPGSPPFSLLTSPYIPGSFFYFSIDTPLNLFELKTDGSFEQKSLHPNLTNLTRDPIILSDGRLFAYRGNVYTASSPFNSWTELNWIGLSSIIASQSRVITLSQTLLRGSALNNLNTWTFESDPFGDDPSAFTPSTSQGSMAHNGEAVYALSHDFSYRRVAYSPDNAVPFSVSLDMPGSSVGAGMIFDAALGRPLCMFSIPGSVIEFYTLNTDGTLDSNAFVPIRDVIGFSNFIVESYSFGYCPTRGKVVAFFRGREESANDSPRWALFLASGDGFNTYDILLRKGYEPGPWTPGSLSSISQDGVFALRWTDSIVLTDLVDDAPAPKFWTSFIGTTEVTP